MSERKRFHPIALVSYFFNSLKSFILLLIILLAEPTSTSDSFSTVIIIAVILAIIVISSLIKYFSRSYIITEDKIVMYKGIFIKNETEIPYERIQTIKQRQWFFYKPFNVVQILIETGSTADKEAEGSLLAVDASLIDIIEQNRYKRSGSKNKQISKSNQNLNSNKNLKSKKESGDENSISIEANIDDDSLYSANNNEYTSGNDDLHNKNYNDLHNKNYYEEELDNEIIYEYMLSNKEILFYALTDLNILLVLLPFVIFLSEIFTEYPFILDFIPEAVFTGVDNLLAQALWVIVIFSIISSLIILLTISVIRSFLYYFEFTVKCSRKTITIEYGLFERKVQKIPLNKIQGIKIYQQVLRKFIRMSSVEILIIGGQEKKGESSLEDKVMILPLIKTSNMYPALQKLFPNYNMEEPEINYVGRGKLFYYWRWILLVMIPIVGVAFYFFTWLGVILLAVTIIFLLINWMDFRYEGYAIMDDNLISIQNFTGFSKVKTFLDRSKIQAFVKHSSYFQLRKGLSHFRFWIKSGDSSVNVGLRFVDIDDIDIVQGFVQNK